MQLRIFKFFILPMADIKTSLSMFTFKHLSKSFLSFSINFYFCLEMSSTVFIIRYSDSYYLMIQFSPYKFCRFVSCSPLRYSFHCFLYGVNYNLIPSVCSCAFYSLLWFILPNFVFFFVTYCLTFLFICWSFANVSWFLV